jgi:hypothetical protein
MLKRTSKRGAAALVAVAFLTLACASAEKNAYRTVGSLSIGVDFAMNAWGEWVRAQNPPAATEARVKDAYEKYQAGMRTLKTAVLTYKAAKEAGAPLDPGVLEAALQGATEFAYQLVSLINSFRTGAQPLTLSDFDPVMYETQTLLYGGR